MKESLATSFPSFRRRTRGVALLALIAMIVGTLIPGTMRAQEVPELQITSTSYMLIDADTGEILAQRNAHERRAPASLTKIFTAIESIEEADPEISITTSESDLVSEMASQVGFSPGETFTVRELLYGMMLPSGNDAARALARGLGAEPGDTAEAATQRFLDRINQRLANMGLTDTQLLNPDGWGIPGHYSSAYDLAAFTMYALRYPRFVQTFSTGTYESDSGEYLFKNNNRMLRTYDGIVGGKTGYDDDAGWCLVNVAERDGNRLIAVTLNGVAPDDWYDDNRVLLDYGFEQMALRAQEGGGLAGEMVRFRDPDAALILSMASASGSIDAAVEQLDASPLELELTTQAQAASSPLQPNMEPVAAESTSVALLRAPSGEAGFGGAGLIVAAAVAAALILLQGVNTWRLPVDGAGPAGRRTPRHPSTFLPPGEQSFETSASASD